MKNNRNLVSYSPWLGAQVDPIAQLMVGLPAAPTKAPAQLMAEPVPSSNLVVVPTRSARPQRLSPMPALTPALQKSIEEIQGARGAALSSKAAQNAALEAELQAAMGRDFQTDLSPLAALVDQWSGGNTSAAYARPESVADRRKETAALQGEISKGQLGMDAQRLANLEADLKQTMGLENMDYERAMAANSLDNNDYWKGLEYDLRVSQLNDEKEERKARAAASGDSLTPGQKALDQSFGKEYAEYTAGGGHASAEKNLQQLQVASQRLAANPGLSGGAVGWTPDVLLSKTNPEAKAVKDDVNQVVMSSLKQLLGSAFTEKEGARVLKATYDDSLPASVNAERIKGLQQQMALAFEQKRRAAEYFERNGTLTGFKGNMPSVGSIMSGVEDAPLEAIPKSASMTTEQKKEYIARKKAELGEK